MDDSIALQRDELCSWVDQLQLDLVSMFHDRHLWRAIRSQLSEVKGDTIWFGHYSRLYATAQVVALRRVVDHNRQTISLWRLMDRIARRPEIVSRDWYLATHAIENFPAFAPEGFAAIASPNGDRIDAKRVRRDCQNLCEKIERAKRYVDQHVAHKRVARLDADLTWQEIDDAIDAAGDTFHRYKLILTATSLATLEPTIQGDALQPFRRPLFGPEDRMPDEQLLDGPGPLPA